MTPLVLHIMTELTDVNATHILMQSPYPRNPGTTLYTMYGCNRVNYTRDTCLEQARYLRSHLSPLALIDREFDPNYNITYRAIERGILGDRPPYNIRGTTNLGEDLDAFHASPRCRFLITHLISWLSGYFILKIPTPQAERIEVIHEGDRVYPFSDLGELR